ncbi:MAG: ECF transporter S component [Deltaproteobacteria bacterium]|nr:ECF transporter S component [Deltaproteobacteria bacterium]
MQPLSVKTVFQKLSHWGLLWAVLYGLMNILSNQLTLPAAPAIAIRPQVALPMIIGFFYGPLPGFVTGFLGNMIGDVLYGYGIGQFWNWHIANGLMGLVPGLAAMLAGIKVMKTVRDFGIIEAAVVVSCAVAVGVAVCLDLLFIHLMKFPESFNAWILPAFIFNAVSGFILVPVFFLLARRVVITLETRTILTITSLLVVAILSTSITITWAMHDDLTSYNALVNAIYFAGIVSVIMVIIGFASSIYFVKRITGPVTLLTEAAVSVEKGEYDLESIQPVSRRTDELGQLSRVLQNMAGEVYQREQTLKKQVEQLQIRIDRKKMDQDVADIVGTDYFQDLREKVKEFRKK